MFPSSPNEDTPRADLQLLTHIRTHIYTYTQTHLPSVSHTEEGYVGGGKGGAGLERA